MKRSLRNAPLRNGHRAPLNGKAKRTNATVYPPGYSNDSLLAGVFDGMSYGGATISQPWELGFNSAASFLSLNRILLCYAYITHGVLQTMIDQPVEDALRGGLDFTCDEIDGEDLEKFTKYLELCGTFSKVKEVLKWSHLFGGAGLIINTDQDPASPFNEDALDEDAPLNFIAADRWELAYTVVNPNKSETPFNYYGQPIHKTRVIKVNGKDAPSFIRQRLQGWGMSDLERVIRDVNSYVKNQNVIYELLDEAKIDIWRIKHFNSQMLSGAASGKIAARLQVATMMKNYHDALIMDFDDEYEQKTMHFSGLGEMMNQIRIGVAASIRMPQSKLFGQSSTGFSSGEDDIENYNAIVESEFRSAARIVLEKVLPLCFKQLFGFKPETLGFEFKKLRVMSAAEEANIATAKFNRYDRMYSTGIITDVEFAKILEQEKLVPIKTECGQGLRLAEPPMAPAADFEKPDRALTTKVPVKSR